MPRCLSLVSAFGLFLTTLPSLAADEPGSTPLKVLFLGDQGHHRPADRAAQISPVLAGRGIVVTYTEDLGQLNLETLRAYDALAVYANTTKISPEQEKGLIDYVEGGGGFVPIHCASYCFLNSDAYVRLVGAQFLRHGTGEFDTKVVDPNHPITRGLTPFHTWDETYVHSKHNPEGRHVLQVRVEGDQEEPWTWTRNQGKGRVFYTAYGHDARTWGNPGFHDLLERGIRWAAGRGEVFDSRPRVAEGLKPFAYTESPDNIPVYLPGQQWGTQGKPSRRMQEPASPEESARHLASPRGFVAKLFAAEPDIAKPICLAWDHRGRLWVAETVDYPNNLQPRGQGHDRIKICEDTDGDGKADKFTVFADGLSIPTSIVFGGGGVIVHQVPDTVLLTDADGDDHADARKVLFNGWGTGDTHAGPSNLRYGFDNWIYGIVGYSGFQGTVGGEDLQFGQGFYRFRPDGSKLEFLRSTSNNSWGVGLSEEGLVFGSTANGCPSVFLPTPNRYYESVRGLSPRVLESIADSNRFFPITEHVRQVDYFGGFTAGAGHALYTARTYPRAYWNKAAFVSEPTGHIVATFALEPEGSNFSAFSAGNLLASDDEWTSPVAAEVGPDGQVWVIDWYNYIVQHNPTPQGFRNGKGNAYETPLRDKTHGRIYRVVALDGPPTAPVKLDPADPQSLLAGLRSDNLLWRLHAQRLLVERGQADVAPALVEMTRDPKVDAIGLSPAAIHALWALKGLNALGGENAPPVADEALSHPSAGVRRNALAVLPREEQSAARIVASGVLKDSNAQVRLAALLALSEMPRSAEVAKVLAEIVADDVPPADRITNDARIVAAAAHDREFLEALVRVRRDQAPAPMTLTVVEKVAEHYARGAPAQSLGSLLVAIGDGTPVLSEAVVAGLATGWPRGKPATLDEAAEKALIHLATSLPPTSRGRLVQLASRLESHALEKYAGVIAESFEKVVRDESQPDDDRINAAQQLVLLRPGDAHAAGELLGLITPRTSPPLAVGLIGAVARSEATGTGPLLAARADAFTPGVRPAALRALLGRGEWTAALLDAAETGQVRLAELTLDQKQALLTHRDRALAGRAKILLAEGGLPDPDRQKVIEELAPNVLNGGDAARGKLVFTAQCSKCHAHSGEGGKIGPDLTGMAAHPREELLVHILDPSRSVEGNFVQYMASTNDGRVINGLLASETKAAVELLDAEGKSHVLQRADIDELQASRKSLMPEGFEKQVSPGDLADLLAFLTRRGKFLPLDLTKAATANSTVGMFLSPESDVETLVFDDWSPKVFEGVPFTLVKPESKETRNVVLLHGPEGYQPPRMPRSVELPVHASVKAVHLLGGVAGWGFPIGEKGSTSMIVRLRYADGTTEDHPLRNGIEVADYIRVVDVPGSKLAFRLRGQQLRYLSVAPGRSEPIEAIELRKGRDDTAPVVMAVTVELLGAE